MYFSSKKIYILALLLPLTCSRMLFSKRRTILEVISWYRKVDQPPMSQPHCVNRRLEKAHWANVSSLLKLKALLVSSIAI